MARQQVLEALQRRGIPAHIAQGIAGNIAVESGFDPGINEISPVVPGSRGGFGLFQHTGPRRRALEAFAQQSGRPLADIDTQIDFALQELQTTERAAGEALLQTQTPEEAARVFSERFLRPGTPHLERRIAAATGGDVSGGAGAPSLLGSEGDDMANGQQRRGGLLGLLGGTQPQQGRTPGIVPEQGGQREGGLLGEGGFLSPDRRDRLILALEGLTLNPNQSLQQMASQGIQGRQQQRQAQQKANQTGEFLRQRGRDDLAEAVESGAVTPAAAVNVALSPPKPPGTKVVNGRLVDEQTGNVIADFSEVDPQESTRIVTGDEAAALGLDPSKSYNVTSSAEGNKATQIGGAGTTVNVGTGETAFNKKTGEFLAAEANEIAKQGAAAQRSIGTIATLRQALDQSPQGFEGALTRVAGNLGIKTEGSSNIELANAIISQLVPAQRPPGSGVMSDADLALFKASLPQLINTREGNQKILDTMEALANYDVQRGQIARKQQLGELNPQQAFDEYAKLGNPLADFARAGQAAPEPEAPGPAPAVQPAARGGATHRFNPETGQVEPIE